MNNEAAAAAVATSALIPAILVCVGAFLLGAIPFGFLMGRAKGVDLREHGSGNIGATNVMRTLGRGPGALVLLLDALKGLIPVLTAVHGLKLSPGLVVAAGVAAILGHIYTPFLRFRGGKGVATSLGVLIGLSPVVAAATVLVFAVTVAATRYVSLGSLMGAVAQAVLFWTLPHHGETGFPLPYRIFSLIAAAFVVIRHRQNIQRLLSGTESKVGAKK